MQIEALRICNLSISRCSPLALAFQGERGNNQARINPMRGVEKKKKKKEKRRENTRVVADDAVARFHSRRRRSGSPTGATPALTPGGLLAGAILAQLVCSRVMVFQVIFSFFRCRPVFGDQRGAILSRSRRVLRMFANGINYI